MNRTVFSIQGGLHLKSVPWAFAEMLRTRIEGNHGGQTLERLQERGGLDPCEMWCAYVGRGLFDRKPRGDEEMRLMKAVHDHSVQ